MGGYADGALQAIYKRAPDLTREGGSIPVTLTFAESLGVNVLLLPMGRGDDGAQYVSSILGFGRKPEWADASLFQLDE